ncbi:hypothetical protein CFP56_004430 [Quercus suber]|uniref:PHD-type domain-containing protein n=1 Tax=Quercus suber TaxID=58331 RepID=A0AAW0II63_QUESU
MFTCDLCVKEGNGYSKCKICKKNCFGCTYRYSCFAFNLQNKCASLPPTMEVEVQNHPLIVLWKWITITCNLCGKEASSDSILKQDAMVAICPLVSSYFFPNSFIISIKVSVSSSLDLGLFLFRFLELAP